MQSIIPLFLCLLLNACDDESNFAPVTDLSNIEPVPRSGVHSVTSGETLYSVAWRYGLDYRYLANLNHITEPYTIYIKQTIYLREHPPVQTAMMIKPITKSSLTTTSKNKVVATTSVSQHAKEPNYTLTKWTWPAQGRVIDYFSSTNKGINITGQKGEPIYAIAPGKVVYAGGGLRGYGKLIIVKHNSLYLSAYAHNDRFFVKEGNWVRQGQKIAEMGNSGADKTMLHFEVRRAGKPVNPMALYKIKYNSYYERLNLHLG